MNYDLDTEEGMKNAVAWTQSLLARINDGGTWAVPRSATVVTLDRRHGRCHVVGLVPDPSIIRVLRAAGYTVTTGETNE